MIGPIKVLLRRGARGTGAVSKNYILIIVCVLTKFITYQFMENCERQDIDLAISTHIANYRAPKFLLCDAASTNDLLAASQKSILQVLETKVRIELLQSSHQYLNVCESQIKLFKKMLRSINFGIPSTAPLLTRCELNCIFAHITNVLNSRPLMQQDENKLVLNANQLCKPFLSNHDQELLMGRFLEEVYNQQDEKELFKKIFKGNNEMAQEALLMLKREFLNTKRMFSDKTQGIKPLKGDLVVILKEDPRLALITDVISDHRVKLKYKNRGQFIEGIFHLKCLGLIYRPATPIHFLATVNSATPLDPLLSSLWQNLIHPLSSPTPASLYSSSQTLPLGNHQSLSPAISRSRWWGCQTEVTY